MAILREQGVNSHIEMAYAFTEAGFEAFDVHMTDFPDRPRQARRLQGRGRLRWLQLWRHAGRGHRLGASITFNPVLAAQFQGFFGRTDTFGLGVCNGCQMFAELADIIPGAQDWPRFTTNQSERFEARLSLVEVLESPACSCKAWRAAACRLRWRTARAMPTSSTGATPTRPLPPCATWTTTAARPSSTRSTPTAAPVASRQ